MSLPTNFFIGRLGRSKQQNFIWAVTDTTSDDMSLYQLDPLTLQVINAFNIYSTYGYRWRQTSGVNSVTCDDDGNIYLMCAYPAAGSGSLYAVVSFSPTGQRRWEHRLNYQGDPVNGNYFQGSYGFAHYRASDDSVYVYANDNTLTGCNIHKVSSDGINHTHFTHDNSTYGTANNNDSPRCFSVAEDNDHILVGGKNTSGADYMYASSFSGSSMTARYALYHNGGLLSMCYSPIYRTWYFSGQYNNDDIQYIKLTNTASHSFTAGVMAYPGSYMYGGSVAADTHPMFSTTGGALMMSYYDNQNSYVVRNTTATAFTQDNVFGTNEQSSGTFSSCYNPVDQKFYITQNLASGYANAGDDIKAFSLYDNPANVASGASFHNVVNTPPNWQSLNSTSRNIGIQHSSSRATQNGVAA